MGLVLDGGQLGFGGGEALLVVEDSDVGVDDGLLQGGDLGLGVQDFGLGGVDVGSQAGFFGFEVFNLLVVGFAQQFEFVSQLVQQVVDDDEDLSDQLLVGEDVFAHDLGQDVDHSLIFRVLESDVLEGSVHVGEFGGFLFGGQLDEFFFFVG